MQRTNIYLREEQLRLLRALREREGTSVADLVRQAVDALVESRGVREVPEDEWARRSGALMDRRRQFEEELGPFDEEEVQRKVAAAVREVREAHAAGRG